MWNFGSLGAVGCIIDLKQTKTAMREHSLNLNLQLQGENGFHDLKSNTSLNLKVCN
jgi:hypothetical protein